MEFKSVNKIIEESFRRNWDGPALSNYQGVTLFYGLIYNKFMVQKISATIRCILCGIVATVLVAGGYLLFEMFFYGAAALSSVPQNIIQGLSGLVIATILHPALKKAIIVTTSS